MKREDIEKIIIEELPRLMARSPAFRQRIIGIMAEVFVKKDELKEVLDAIKELREDFDKRFEEHSKRLEEMSLRLEEHSKYIGQLIKRQEEHSQHIKELMKRQDEHAKRLESAIGGLGARWGIMSEESFREGLKGILKELGLKVERYIDNDTEGHVFGRPEQIELDVVIRDSVVLLAEIKSSISKEEIYVFQRKVEFYEKNKGVKAVRKAIISPFVDPRARPIAEKLDIEVYTSGYDVKV